MDTITDGGCEFDPAAPLFHQHEDQDTEPQVRNKKGLVRMINISHEVSS